VIQVLKKTVAWVRVSPPGFVCRSLLKLGKQCFETRRHFLRLGSCVAKAADGEKHSIYHLALLAPLKKSRIIHD
jgi:hypothetical protein